MKELTGKNKDVQDYVMQWDETKTFITKINDMLEFLLPNYIKEGKARLVIGIGCTGGKHRSVTIADAIYRSLKENSHKVVIEHRDIEKR
jgi:UPF0042 nucleotide-binding protein